MIEKIGFLFGLLICVILIFIITFIAIGGTLMVIYAVKEIKDDLSE